MEIQYVIGDATEPVGEGAKIIAHVCNDIGLWGAGFTKSLSAKWKEPEEGYRRFYNEGSRFLYSGLGTIQMIQVETEPNIMVCNMIAQRGVRSRTNPTPIQYDHLGECLRKLYVFAHIYNSSVHMPRIGCGLAGGTWDKVEPIIKACLIDQGISVTVYDLPQLPTAA